MVSVKSQLEKRVVFARLCVFFLLPFIQFVRRKRKTTGAAKEQQNEQKNLREKYINFIQKIQSKNSGNFGIVVSWWLLVGLVDERKNETQWRLGFSAQVFSLMLFCLCYYTNTQNVQWHVNMKEYWKKVDTNEHKKPKRNEPLDCFVFLPCSLWFFVFRCTFLFPEEKCTMRKGCSQEFLCFRQTIGVGDSLSLYPFASQDVQGSSARLTAHNRHLHHHQPAQNIVRT